MYKSSKTKSFFSTLWYSHSGSYLLIGLCLLLVSCTKEIDVVPDTGIETNMVVEGWIENGEYAVVKLSRSSGYFDPIPSFFDTLAILDYILNDIVVQNATIVVSDGLIADTLLPTLNFIDFTRKYSLPYVYLGKKLKGEVGKTYTLEIIAEGKNLTSTTKIPELVDLDSLYWKPLISDENYGFPWAKMTDPDTSGNGYRMFTKRGGIDLDYTAALGSEFDDFFINGTSFDFPFNRGEQLADDTLPNSVEDKIYGKYKKGEIMEVKFCTTDKATYDFWRTFSISQQTGGSPFAAPINLKSNIKGNGGIGVWSGYGATYISAIAQ